MELPAEACTDKSKVERLLRSMYGCRDAGVNWDFAICHVMIGIGFVQVEHRRASSAIWKSNFVCGYTETTLYTLGYIINVKRFSCETARCLGCHESRILAPLGYHDCVQSIRVLAGSYNGLLMSLLGKQIRDMPSLSGSRSE